MSLFSLPAVTSQFFFQKAVYYFISKIFYCRTEAVAWRGSVKKASQISGKSHLKIPVSEFFLSEKLQDRGLWFFKIFKNTYFVERRRYFCENIYHKEFLKCVYLAKNSLPWCLLNNQKKCVSLGIYKKQYL